MKGAVAAMHRRSSRWPLRLLIVLVVAAGLGALVWRLGLRSEPSFAEYPMLAKTDIPTALDIGPNGAVWFTIEFSDAIGVFRNGKIDRLSKGSQNLEPRNACGRDITKPDRPIGGNGQTTQSDDRGRERERLNISIRRDVRDCPHRGVGEPGAAGSIRGEPERLEVLGAFR